MKNKDSGFTLVEFLLVIIMIGLLISVILPRARLASDEARFSQIFQHGSEIAGHIVTWSLSQVGGLPENAPYSMKDILLSELDPEIAGFESYPLVNRYTGDEHFNGIEELYPFEHLPKNPFNNTSYFDPINNDSEEIPSSNPGLLYLTSMVAERLNQPYRYFYLLITGTDGEWYGDMSLEGPEGVRQGIFVTQMPASDEGEFYRFGMGR